MSYFTVRVELHYASETDYEKLHAAMARQGFSRQIVGKDGRTYHLPTAEYSVRGNYTGDYVRQAAATAAASTGKKYAVLVTSGDSVSWQGLIAA